MSLPTIRIPALPSRPAGNCGTRTTNYHPTQLIPTIFPVLEGDFGLRAPMPWAVQFAISWCPGGNTDDRLLEFYRQMRFCRDKEQAEVYDKRQADLRNTVNLQPDLHRTSYGPLAARNIEITKEGKKVRIQIGSQTVGVDADFFPKKGHFTFPFGGGDYGELTPGNYIVAAAVKADRAYVAVCEDAWHQVR